MEMPRKYTLFNSPSSLHSADDPFCTRCRQTLPAAVSVGHAAGVYTCIPPHENVVLGSAHDESLIGTDAEMAQGKGDRIGGRFLVFHVIRPDKESDERRELQVANQSDKRLTAAAAGDGHRNASLRKVFQRLADTGEDGHGTGHVLLIEQLPVGGGTPFRLAVGHRNDGREALLQRQTDGPGTRLTAPPG